MKITDMMRILDAKSEDMGLKKVINSDTITPEGLAKLVQQLSEGEGNAAI